MSSVVQLTLCSLGKGSGAVWSFPLIGSATIARPFRRPASMHHRESGKLEEPANILLINRLLRCSRDQPPTAFGLMPTQDCMLLGASASALRFGHRTAQTS